MDEKNITNRGLTIEDYNNLVVMLKASLEDAEVAMSNIDNLKDDSEEWNIILKLLYKEVTFAKRHAFASKLLKVGWYDNPDSISYKQIYSEIKDIENDTYNLKPLFNHVFNREVYKTYAIAYDFVDELNTTIKW